MNISSKEKSDLFRLLPSVDELLRHEQVQTLSQREGRAATLAATRAALDRLRDNITAGTLDEAEIKSKLGDLPREVELLLQQSLAYSLRPVINATGVILHTNLGERRSAAPRCNILPKFLGLFQPGVRPHDW